MLSLRCVQLVITLFLAVALSDGRHPRYRDLKRGSRKMATGQLTKHIHSFKSTGHHKRTFNSLPVVHPVAFDEAANMSSTLNVTTDVSAYIASVSVGNPPQKFNLFLDTGSSNTWVGAQPSRPYIPTNTSQNTEQEVTVIYGAGGFTGHEFTDQVAFADLVLTEQGVGSSSAAFGFNSDVDGILGIGPTGLTLDTLSPGSDQTVPTVIDTALRTGQIPSDTVGLFLAPVNSGTGTNVDGEITFGDIDQSKYTGPLQSVPFTTTAPASQFVGIDQAVTYGDSGVPILNTTAGIIDTGTTLLLLATDAFERYTKATGATLDNTTGFFTVTQDQFNNMQNLTFLIGTTSYQMPRQAQIWPQSLNAAIDGDPSAIYLAIGDLGSPSGQGLDFINGQTFLEQFYTSYSISKKTFSIANSVAAL